MSGLDFFVNYALKTQAYTLQAHENGEAHTSVCLMMKSILLLNSSCNNNSVDNVPSQ